MTMKTLRFKLDTVVAKWPAGRVNVRKLEGTPEADLKAQQNIDAAAAAQDAALFAQRVRKRLGLTQLEFSRRIDVSLDDTQLGAGQTLSHRSGQGLAQSA
jgi:putative transcriptional regulator